MTKPLGVFLQLIGLFFAVIAAIMPTWALTITWLVVGAPFLIIGGIPARRDREAKQ